MRKKLQNQINSKYCLNSFRLNIASDTAKTISLKKYNFNKMYTYITL